MSVAELTAYVESALWIRQGVARIRELLLDLDENSWSPQEPVMRRTWEASGCGRPRTNFPVFDLSGRFVGTPDLLDLRAGVYGMYDGALHLAGAVRHADVAKEAAYRALGLEGVTMMAGDLADRDPFQVRLRRGVRPRGASSGRRQTVVAGPARLVDADLHGRATTWPVRFRTVPGAAVPPGVLSRSRSGNPGTFW